MINLKEIATTLNKEELKHINSLDKERFCGQYLNVDTIHKDFKDIKVVTNIKEFNKAIFHII